MPLSNIRGKLPNRTQNGPLAGVTVNQIAKKRKRGRRIIDADRRRFAYARYQDLWNDCPKKIADIVVANDLSLTERSTLPERHPVRELYESLWGVPGPETRPWDKKDKLIPVSVTLSPIIPLNVKIRIAHIKNGTAADPDGVKNADLRQKGICLALSKLYNALLLADHYPKAWRANRTTLFPKPEKNVTDVKNWRPSPSARSSAVFIPACWILGSGPPYVSAPGRKALRKRMVATLMSNC